MNPSESLITRRIHPSPIPRARLALVVASLLLASATVDSAWAQRMIDASPQNYRQAIRNLKPGDTLRLAPGNYDRGLPLRSLSGTATAPITITGPETGRPAVLLGQNGQITISLIDVSHLVIRKITLNGQGARAHAIVAEGRGSFAHHITLEHLAITGYNASQAFNGISTKAPAWNWVIRDNLISNVGTGIYLGNSNGAAPFVAGLIEGNVIERTIGYNMQIKHQIPRPDLAGLPTTPQQTVIRRNIFDKSGPDVSNGRARPNLLLGHWPLEGAGSQDRYVVHANLFYQNPSERLFQAEGNVAVYNNLFINTHRQAVGIQPHKHQPREIDFHNNTVIGRGPAVTIRGLVETHSPRTVGNLIYSEAQPVGLAAADNKFEPLANAPSELIQGLQSIDGLGHVAAPHTRQTATNAMYEKLNALTGFDRDFNDNLRKTAVYGAFSDTAGMLSQPVRWREWPLN